MKCFAHPASDAVGSCKHCAKGTCSPCAVDTGQGLACSSECAEQVRLVASLTKTASAASGINRRGAAYVMPAFLFTIGLTFIGHALLTGRTGSGLTFALVMGGMFVFFGFLLGYVQYAWHKRAELG